MKKFSIRKESALDMLLVLLGGIVLCFMGFYNTFPYVYNDCGTYIGSGFDLKVPMDRPIFYGLFVRHVSLLTSLWLVILVQGVILSLLLFYYFKYLSGTRHFRIYYIAFIILITFFTAASFHVSQLIPDIFTSVAILSLGLLLLAKDMKTRDIIITSIFLVLAISVHNSHFLISLTLVFLTSLVFLFQKYRKKMTDLFVSGKRLVYSWVVIIFAFLMVCTVHSILGGGFALSRAGQVFLLVRTFDMGLLDPYLQENCSKYHYKICDYKDKMPFDILWDYGTSPLYVNGGWETPEKLKEYKTIVTDMLTTPKYGHLFIVKAIESGFTQLFCFSLAEATPQREGTPSFMAISVHYPAYLKTMRCSHQWNQSLSFTFINYFINEFQKFITAISVLFYMIALVYSSKFKRFNKIMLFVVGGVVINAFVCGGLSGVAERYECRVIWLLPLPIFLILANKEFLLEKFRKIFS